jgi:hypothetical protein
MCRKEIRWAQEAERKIVPVCSQADKGRIGQFIQESLVQEVDFSAYNFVVRPSPAPPAPQCEVARIASHRPPVRTPPQDVDRSAPSRLKASLEDIIDQAGLAKGPAKKLKKAEKGGSRKSVGSRRASSTEEISATKIQAVERGRASRAA